MTDKTKDDLKEAMAELLFGKADAYYQNNRCIVTEGFCASFSVTPRAR